MPAGVGERLLDDPVRGELDTRIEPPWPSGEDQPGRRPRGVARLVEQPVQLPEAGLRRELRAVELGVLAQDSEQPAHLGERGAGGVADRAERSRADGRHPGRSEARRFGLHRDHRDVVRHDVMQLACDPGPLAASGMLEQIPRRGSTGGIVAKRLAARPARDPEERRRRRECR